MRKFSFVLTMLALVLVFSLAFVSCGDDDGNNNTPGGQTPGGNTPGVSSYTITFNANGGSGAVPAPQSVSYGSRVVLVRNTTLIKSGCTFGGWNTKPDGTGYNYNAPSQDYIHRENGDVTLYAKWYETSYSGNSPYTGTWTSTANASRAATAVFTDSSFTITTADGTGRGVYRKRCAADGTLNIPDNAILLFSEFFPDGMRGLIGHAYIYNAGKQLYIQFDRAADSFVFSGINFTLEK